MSLLSDTNLKILPKTFVCVLHKSQRMRLFKYSEKLHNGCTKHFEPSESFLQDISTLHSIGLIRFRLSVSEEKKLLSELPFRFHKISNGESVKLQKDFFQQNIRSAMAVKSKYNSVFQNLVIKSINLGLRQDQVGAKAILEQNEQEITNLTIEQEEELAEDF